MKGVEATVANMRRYENCLAWSPRTGEEYSATPGDYFYLSEQEPLRDGLGLPMLLVRRRTGFVSV